MTDRHAGGPSRRAFLGGSAAVAAAMAAFVPSSRASAQATPEPASASTVDIRQFGAIGNYAGDDTPAIQAAIDSLGPDGGIVIIPRGTWYITAPILLRSSIELRGDNLNSIIAARSPDCAIRVTDSETANRDIYLRRLTFYNDAGTPIGVDARYMTGCGIEECAIIGFDAVGLLFGGNTNEENASWSNTAFGTIVSQSPTCIRFDGVHSEGGSPANWMTIERCMIVPTDTTESVGIDLVNGDTVRIVDNDISYAPSATGIVIRQHLYGQLEYNRFEDIGQAEPSHPIEKEFGFSNFQVTGVLASMHYEPADYLRFSSVESGTFTLQRGEAITQEIAFDPDADALASAVGAALAAMPQVGIGNVDVTADDGGILQVVWRNGRGRADRPDLEVASADLDGEIVAFRGSTADAIARARDIVLAAVVNGTDTEQRSVAGEHLDIGIPIVTRGSIVAVNPPGTASVRMHRNDEAFPRLDLTVDGQVRWTDPETGSETGTLAATTDTAGPPHLTWSAGSASRRLFAGFTVAAEAGFGPIDPGDLDTARIDAPGAQPGDAVSIVPPPALPAGAIATAVVVEPDVIELRVVNMTGDDLAIDDDAAWTFVILSLT